MRPLSFSLSPPPPQCHTQSSISFFVSTPVREIANGGHLHCFARHKTALETHKLSPAFYFLLSSSCPPSAWIPVLLACFASSSIALFGNNSACKSLQKIMRPGFKCQFVVGLSQKGGRKKNQGGIFFFTIG